MDFPCAETVTIQSPGTVADPYSGETVTDWATYTERDESCAVAPGGSSEPTTVDRNANDSDLDPTSG